MQLMKIIPSYNSSDIPISREQIGKYLRIINEEQDKLTSTDRKILDELAAEFEYEVDGTTKKQMSLFKKSESTNVFKSKYYSHLYDLTDEDITFYSDFHAALSYRQSGGDGYRNYYQSITGPVNYDRALNHSFPIGKIMLYDFDLRFRGTMYNSVGYFLKLGYGRFSYSTNDDIYFAAVTDPDLNGNDNFVDEKKNFNSFEGYLRYRTDGEWLALTFGRSALNNGFGYIDKLFLSNNTIPFDFGKLDLKYKKVSYSFTYGTIKGDSIGITNRDLLYAAGDLSAKTIATHLLNINFSDGFKLGLWESIIASNQPFSFAFLNPVSFLTSADLGVGVQQTTENNSLIGIQTEVIPVKNLSMQGSFLIDDLNFETLGKNDSLNENKFGWQLGAMYNFHFNVSAALEYTHLDPFVYSHRSNKSTYTNKLMPLGHALPPNSDEIAIKIAADITSRIKLELLYQHQRSGTGIFESHDSITGSTKLINYGGEINFGLGDAYVKTNGFLDGIRINRDLLTVNLSIEPLRQIFIEAKYQYRVLKYLEKVVDFKEKYVNSYFFATLKMLL